MLEKQAIDLTIPSSANSSLERFKNGILVDNFVDQTTADIGSREFKAGYDKVNQVLTTRQKNNIIDITPNTFANTVKTGDLITLTFDHTSEYEQRSATRTRNLARTHEASTMWIFHENSYWLNGHKNVGGLTLCRILRKRERASEMS